MTKRAAILLSIKPEYAKNILQGVKRGELRRKMIHIELPAMIVLYATFPQKAVLGVCQLSSVFCGTVDETWEKAKMIADISRRTYNDYFMGSDKAFLMHVENEVTFERPVCLKELMEALDGTGPPQSFRYLNDEQKDTILRLGGFYPEWDRAVDVQI